MIKNHNCSFPANRIERLICSDENYCYFILAFNNCYLFYSNINTRATEKSHYRLRKNTEGVIWVAKGVSQLTDHFRTTMLETIMFHHLNEKVLQPQLWLKNCGS